MRRRWAMKANVIARLTVTRANGWCTIVEIPADASFHSFYRFYRQLGAKRSTKTPIRTANRNEGLSPVNAHLQRPGLDLVQERLKAYSSQSNPVVSVKLRIIRKRLYRKLINANPSELGLVTTRVNLPIERIVPIRIPVQLTPIKLSVGSVAQADRNGF